MSKELRIRALRLHQNGYRLFLTGIKAGDLPRFTKVDKYDPDKALDHREQGYQRSAEMPRVKKFANWLRRTIDDGGRVLVPTSVLLSARDHDIEFDEAAGELVLHSDRKLHLVDGQHRTRGFEYAINDKKMLEAAAIEMPVVIVEGLNKMDEMQQFAVVNGTQKSVRTDLVNMILTQLAAKQGDAAIEEKDQWKVVVTRVIEILNTTEGSPWHEMILMPNESTHSADREPGDTIPLVRATSFMTSLRPIYEYLKPSFFGGMTTQKRAERLAQYILALWGALRELNPDCFDEPHEYVLQKTPGLFSIHSLAVQVMPVMHMSRIEWDVEGFKRFLEPCEELSSSEFWNRKTGDASRYGSMKGFADLADLLWESLKA